jgi:hypothetical protein
MDEPDPDPLLPFLVPNAPTSNPPRSAAPTASPCAHPSDPQPSSLDPHDDGSQVPAPPSAHELEAIMERGSPSRRLAGSPLNPYAQPFSPSSAQSGGSTQGGGFASPTPRPLPVDLHLRRRHLRGGARVSLVVGRAVICARSGDLLVSQLLLGRPSQCPTRRLQSYVSAPSLYTPCTFHRCRMRRGSGGAQS